MDGCAGRGDARSADLTPQRGWAMRRLGCTDYVATWRAMQTFTDARTAGTPDEIWLTEHGAIYTLGLAASRCSRSIAADRSLITDPASSSFIC